MACLPPAADAPHPLGLLRARGERPSSHRSAEQRDEVASVQLIELHSIPARAELQDIESARDSQEVLVLSRLQSRLRTHLPFLCDTLGLLGKAHMSPLTRGSLRLEQTGRTPMTMRPDPTFHASPKLAMEAPPENFAYTLLLSPDFSKPDALAVIDAKPGSPTFSQIVHTVTMPSRW